MTENVEEIAAKLGAAQRRRLRGDLIVLRSCHDTRVALNLARKGLAQRGRHLNQYVWSPLGLAVRAILLERQKGRS